MSRKSKPTVTYIYPVDMGHGRYGRPHVIPDGTSMEQLALEAPDGAYGFYLNNYYEGKTFRSQSGIYYIDGEVYTRAQFKKKFKSKAHMKILYYMDPFYKHLVLCRHDGINKPKWVGFRPKSDCIISTKEEELKEE